MKDSPLFLIFQKLALIAGLPMLCHAEEVSLAPLMDAAVSEANPDGNYATANLVAGQLSGQAWESYLRFDLGEIPAGATISSATLRLRGVTTSISNPVRVEQVAGAWAEGGLTWNQKPAATTLFEAALVRDGFIADFDFPEASLGYLQDVVNGVATDRGVRLSVPQAGADENFTFQSAESGDEARLFVEFTPPAAIPDFAGEPQAEPLRTKLQPSLGSTVEPWELLWNTEPDVRYQVWKSADLNSWDVMPGYPREADSLADSELLPGPVEGDPDAFYRVEVLDEQAPAIESRFPSDGAFAIRRFYPSRAEVGVLLSDATGIDPDSVSLTLSGRGTFTLSSPELSLSDGLLNFETGGDTALGAYGETVNASLSVGDPAGNAATYDWSFVMEEQVVLAEDLLVFGSGEAQRSGQRVPHTPTRMLAGDPGPVRANTNGWDLIEVTADTLVIGYDSSAPSFPVDQYLTNRTPRTVDEIFYRKVVSTSDDPANQRLTITTVDVPASEIMQAGSASLSGEEVAFEVDEAGNIIAARSIRALEASGEFQVQPVVIDWSGKDVAGFYTQPDNTTGMELSLDLDEQAPGGADWDGKLSLKQARLSCAPTLTVAAKTSFSKGVEKFYAEAELDVDAIIEPKFEFFSADLPGLDKKKTLWRHDFIIPIAGTPLWITVTPRLNARAQFSAGLSGTFSVGASGGFTDTMIVDYVKDRDPSLEFGREIGNFRFDLIDPAITLSGQIDASATIEPEIEVKLISLVGFYVNVDPTVYAGLSADYTPPDLVSAEATLGVRGNLNAGMAITGVDDSLLPAFEPWELFDEGWAWNFPEPVPGDPLVITGQPQSVSVPGGGTVRLRVQTNHSTGVSYQWFKDGRQLLDDGPELVRYGASAGTAGEYRVVVSHAGDDVVSDLAMVTVGSTLLVEHFDDVPLHPWITTSERGTFLDPPGVKSNAALGGDAYGFGRSTKSSNAFENYQSSLVLTFPEPVFVSKISFRIREEAGDWGSYGRLYVDGEVLSGSGFALPTNTRSSWGPRDEEVTVDRVLSELTINIVDITSSSQVFMDDVIVFGGTP